VVAQTVIVRVVAAAGAVVGEFAAAFGKDSGSHGDGRTSEN